MTEYFFINECQNRQDGVSNTLATVVRSTEPLANSYYYERMSKMSANTEFVSFWMSLTTSTGRIIKMWEQFDTAYVAPAETEEQ